MPQPVNVTSSRDPSLMRLVTYNILHSGMGRLDPIYETLLYLAGDFVGLCEVQDPRAAAYLAGKLGMEHAVAEASDGKHHVALLSRVPIQRTVNLGVAGRGIERGALEVMVRTDAGPLRIVVVHLPSGIDPASEKRRLAQLNLLLPLLEAERDTPTAILGDFNADSPHHPTDLAAMSAQRRRLLDESGGKLSYDVVERMLAAGWSDAYQISHRGQPQHTLTTGFPAQRVDYIWLDHALVGRLAHAGIDSGGFSPYCSDHFPLWADLRSSAKVKEA